MSLEDLGRKWILFTTLPCNCDRHSDGLAKYGQSLWAAGACFRTVEAWESCHAEKQPHSGLFALLEPPQEQQQVFLLEYKGFPKTLSSQVFTINSLYLKKGEKRAEKSVELSSRGDCLDENSRQGLGCRPGCSSQCYLRWQETEEAFGRQLLKSELCFVFILGLAVLLKFTVNIFYHYHLCFKILC